MSDARVFTRTVHVHDLPGIPVGPRISQVLDDITCEGRWARVVQGLHECGWTDYFQQAFASYWITAGHHIRHQIGDDRRLAEILRKVLPPYAGEALLLYRGENAAALEAGRVGFAWTPLRDVAEMFGRGLNAEPGGGVLLVGRFAPRDILSGPNRHSRHLGELQYTVDPCAYAAIEVVDRYPAPI